MTKPLTPDSFVKDAGGGPGDNQWYGYILALHDHLVNNGNSTKWNVDQFSDNASDTAGLTVVPDAAGESFQVNFRNDTANNDMYMAVDPNSSITDPNDPVGTGSSEVSPENSRVGITDPASRNFHNEILIFEWVDAIGFVSKSDTNRYTPNWAFGGKIYEPTFANQPNIDFDGLGWHGGQPRSIDNGLGEDTNFNRASQLRTVDGWVTGGTFLSEGSTFPPYNSNNPRDGLGGEPTAELPSTYLVQDDNNNGAVFGTMKYMHAQHDTGGGLRSIEIVDPGKGPKGWMYMSHDGNSYSLSVPWDPTVNPTPTN